ncbi:MAG TPA: hypothetical protein PLM07_10810 [Candidatus Rifleibacterium sp.]|nr:hypothetical protein [Candidatus Rifleibacterium sp.]HPT46382.1 hypothetical protein [Candidatus Rifleibacterium sp.]
MRAKYFGILLGVFCLIFAGQALHGLSIAPPYEPYDDDLVQVSIVGDERGDLETWSAYRHHHYHSSPRLSVLARQGERYTIRVTNTSGSRLAVVISVDGLNIISGDRSDNASNESMYVLDPGQTGNFSGWRSGMSHVQRFYFTSAGDSYAGRKGQRDQLGMIRISAFREQRVVYRPYDDSELKSSAPRSSMAESGPGTGYGENTWSPVSLTDFTPVNSPSQSIEIRYEWETPRYYKYEDHAHQDFAEPPPR